MLHLPGRHEERSSELLHINLRAQHRIDPDTTTDQLRMIDRPHHAMDRTAGTVRQRGMLPADGAAMSQQFLVSEVLTWAEEVMDITLILGWDQGVDA